MENHRFRHLVGHVSIRPGGKESLNTNVRTSVSVS